MWSVFFVVEVEYRVFFLSLVVFNKKRTDSYIVMSKIEALRYTVNKSK